MISVDGQPEEERRKITDAIARPSPISCSWRSAPPSRSSSSTSGGERASPGRLPRHRRLARLHRRHRGARAAVGAQGRASSGLHRLVHDPARLWRRYLVRDSEYPFILLRQLRKQPKTGQPRRERHDQRYIRRRRRLRPGARFCPAPAVALHRLRRETGPYVWASEVNAPTTMVNEADFRLRETDTVYVHVFNQDNLSTHERIRPDGKISVPTVGEVMARGRRPSELAKELEVKLKNMVVAPQRRRQRGRDGADPRLGARRGEERRHLHHRRQLGSPRRPRRRRAVSTTSPRSDRIFLVRKGLDRRIRFRLADLEADKKSATFALQPGDVIVVE